MGLETDKSKLRQNADDVTLNLHLGVLVRRRCPVTGLRSFISHAGYHTASSYAFTDIPQYLQYSGRKLIDCELIFMQCRNAKIIVS